MVSASLTAPSPAALPPLATLVIALGLQVVFVVLIAAFAIGAAVVLQHALTSAPPRRRAVRIVERPRAPLSSAA